VVAMMSTQPIKMAMSLTLLGGGFILSIVNDVNALYGNQGDFRKPPLTDIYKMTKNGMGYCSPSTNG